MKNTAYRWYLYFKNNKSIFFVLFFSLFAGIIFGVFVFLKTPEYLNDLKSYADKSFSVFTLNKLDKKDIFFNYALSNIKIIVVIWISGLFVFLIPFSFFQLFLKGLRMGYVIAFFTAAYRFKGILYIFLSNLTSFALIIPLIITYSVLSIKSFHNIKSKNILNRILNKKNFVCLIAAFSLILISGFIDAYIISDILKAFTGYFM